MADLKEVYQAATCESAEAHLRQLSQKWNDQYAIAIRPWQNSWADLATFFAYPAEIRRLIHTTNSVRGYHRYGLCKVICRNSLFAVSHGLLSKPRAAAVRGTNGVHGTHLGRAPAHGFFRNMTEKLRSFREIRVQRVLKPDFAKAMLSPPAA